MTTSTVQLVISVAVLAAVAGTCFTAHAQAEARRNASLSKPAPSLSAKWIWKRQQDYNRYNDTIIARKTFSLPDIRNARMIITADTRYRLFINGEWVNDGPCRSWPAHYQYDEFDVTPYLRTGENELRVIAKFFGVGTFHQIPQQAGLLVQLDERPVESEPVTIISDGSWEAADAGGWFSRAPKQCVQMGPFEIYDARRASPVQFEPAAVLYEAYDGPWQDLNPRDCPLLTREPFALRNFVGASIVRGDWMTFCFPTAQLLYPGVVKSNNQISMASAVATVIECPDEMTLHIDAPGQTVTINGKRGKRGAFQLNPGDNFMFAAVTSYFGHWQQDTEIRFIEPKGFELHNPLDGNTTDPWCFVPFEDTKFVSSDVEFALMDGQKKTEVRRKIEGSTRKYLKTIVDVASFKRELEGQAQTLSSAGDVTDDIHWQFEAREVVGDASDLIENPAGLLYDNAEMTVVQPSTEGDIELAYDFGEQNCGYYQFDLIAEEGLQMDIFGVEYITPAGRVQHTGAYRNGMRYICKEGVNRFTSFVRRSGRYLFVTLRNQTKPVTIRNIRLIESTYPVVYRGRFACSDAAIERIWEISARTLKLCMEDTFTDCPLYEQTLWVGDARNEAVFGFTAFGAEDLARRCITLTGLSLEQFPITLCQVPSTWETLLPAWSFLWGISVWDYYYYSGDKPFLERVWPWVMQNLEGSARFSDERGLFSGPFWNMFDWSGIDDGHNTVLHNSMFVVGAIDAALKCAEVLDDEAGVTWLRSYREKLVTAINELWNEQKKAYPDSIHGDGTISDRTSVHTSFLSLLYDIVEDENRNDVLNNILSPPDDMVKVGSPFAIMYMFEALEKAGHADRIIERIYESYLPMLETGATTVWESFSTGTTGGGGFPTRSHCHAWSSAPIHFLNRIILGIVPEEAGGKAFAISPRLSGLTWANGASATINGSVEVSWAVEDGTLNVTATAPDGVSLRFVPNDTHKWLDVVFNGKPVP